MIENGDQRIDSTRKTNLTGEAMETTSESGRRHDGVSNRLSE